MTSETRNFGVTFPDSLAKSLDQIRGDIPRSTFLQRLVQFVDQESVNHAFKRWLKIQNEKEKN